jgi:hypothetical protein
LDTLKVLFISQTVRVDQPYLDPSVRYRCYNFAEDIRALGGIADVVALQKFQLGMIDLYDYFIFHRPGDGKVKLYEILNEVRQQNKGFHADYDDLIFSAEHALQCSIYLNKIKTKTETLHIFNKNRSAFDLFESFTTSTKPLAQKIQCLAPKTSVKVVHNGLSSSLLRSYGFHINSKWTHRAALPRRVISYLSGTTSHNCDFAYIEEILIHFLKKHREFCLCVAGPLEFNVELFPKDSVYRQRHKPFREFFRSASDAYFNIAPLMPNNAFNECKSALKFFESGIWGVPTIASPIGDFKRFSDCEGLQLPESRKQWKESLERLAEPGEYEKATQGLSEYCLSNCQSHSSTNRLLVWIDERMKGFSHEYPFLH